MHDLNLLSQQLRGIAIALSVVPALAIAQDRSWSQASAEACYAGQNTKEEVLKAVSCLKTNPVASSAIVEEFKRAKQELLDGDTEIAAAFGDLVRQKSAKLYVRYYSPSVRPKLLVVERAVLGGAAPIVIYDLQALGISYTYASSHFGKDKTVPLGEVSSFRYRTTMPNLGELVTTFANSTQTTDMSYQGGYPLKAVDPAGKWRGVVEFAGTSYPGKVANDDLKLSPSFLSTYDVTFLTEDEGKRLVAQFEAEALAQQQANERAARAAAEQRRVAAEAEVARKAKVISEMSKAERGSEDSCKRLGTFFATGDPDNIDIECQFAGRINLADLKDAGWLVVSKQRDSSGTVREYFIRKVR